MHDKFFAIGCWTLWILSVILSLTFMGVMIWGVIKLVNHFT